MAWMPPFRSVTRHCPPPTTGIRGPLLRARPGFQRGPSGKLRLRRLRKRSRDDRTRKMEEVHHLPSQCAAGRSGHGFALPTSGAGRPAGAARERHSVILLEVLLCRAADVTAVIEAMRMWPKIFRHHREISAAGAPIAIGVPGELIGSAERHPDRDRPRSFRRTRWKRSERCKSEHGYCSLKARVMLSTMGLAMYCAKVRWAVWIMISVGMPGVGVKPGTRSI